MTDLVLSQQSALDSLDVLDVSILAGSIAPSSAAMYKRDIKAYRDWAGSPQIALLPTTFARWRAYLANETTYSPRTINRMLIPIRCIVREAEKQGYIPSGTYEQFRAIQGVRLVAMKERLKKHNRVKVEPVVMRAITETPSPDTLRGLRDSALLHTLASSGMRVHELATLTYEQINETEDGVTVSIQGKNDLVPRNVPITREAHAAILRWLSARPVSSPYIFTGFGGRGTSRALSTRLTEVSIWKIIRAQGDAQGVEHLKPHDFRRFVGTRLAKKDPRAAQLTLGHKSISTTYDNYVLDELPAGITEGLY